MQTHLMIDKQSLIYDNQQPQWQRFIWPADTVASGASLSWITTNTHVFMVIIVASGALFVY